jgi:hypothetical protein
MLAGISRLADHSPDVEVLTNSSVSVSVSGQLESVNDATDVAAINDGSIERYTNDSDKEIQSNNNKVDSSDNSDGEKSDDNDDENEDGLVNEEEFDDVGQSRLDFYLNLDFTRREDGKRRSRCGSFLIEIITKEGTKQFKSSQFLHRSESIKQGTHRS